MEIPQPPQDEELRNIIDKLANFVARNGVDFEQMTKQKQRDNPKFAFLFGGEFFNYYMYRVTTEQAILKNQMRGQSQHGQQQGGFGGGGFGQFGPGPRMMGQGDVGQTDEFERRGGGEPFDNFQHRGAPGGPGPRFGGGGSEFGDRPRPGFQQQPRPLFEPGMPGAAPPPRLMAGNFGPRPRFDGPRGPSRFDQGSFEPGSGSRFDQGPTGGSRFDQGPSGGGRFGPGPPGGSRFDQGPGGGRFDEGPSGGRFDQGPAGGRFDEGSNGGSRFDQGPPGVDRFDQGPPGVDRFDQGPPGGSRFDQGPAGGGRFDQRPAVAGRFDQGPVGEGRFDQGPAGGRPFDRSPVGRFDQSPGRVNRFEEGPGGASRFDQSPGAGLRRFDQGPPSRFEQSQSPNRFEPAARRFDQGPGGRFDQGPPPSRFEGSPNRFEKPSRFEQGQDFDQRGNVQGIGLPTLPVGNVAAFDGRSNTNFDSPTRMPLVSSRFSAGPVDRPGLLPMPEQGLIELEAPITTPQIEALKEKRAELEDQIKQSEVNLTAQQQVLVTQQQTQIDEAIMQLERADMLQLAKELNINLGEFDSVLQRVIDTCTKDSISAGKAWIFTHTSTPRHYKVITSFLLQKTLDPTVEFTQRLHIIYLINDVLHHCMRKGAEDLQQALEQMVIPMFCFAKVAETGNEENLTKLEKLFGLWETKHNYVSPAAVQQLRNYGQTLMDYKTHLMQVHMNVVSQIISSIQETFERYQGQHQKFCQHASENVKNLEQQIQITMAQEKAKRIAERQQKLIQQQQPVLQPLMGVNHGLSLLGPVQLPQSLHSFPPSGQGLLGSAPGQGLIAPPYNPPSEMNMPDLSRPPPGFPTPPPDKDLIPALPYYELPAGLMVPLVKLDDDSYKPIDPKTIRLPPPCPPTERLQQAVEAFYALPSHERPRDSEGWERLGLYEYFKAKNTARKQKEDDIRDGKRQKSRSPTPIRRMSSPNGGRSPPRRRYQSKSPTSTRSDRRKSRSRSRSPVRRRRRKSRSRSRSPLRRSPTPPSFMTAGLGMTTAKIDESNKGHQLLKKMGWGGTGLGINEQGIEAPISGGEVRDRKDQYKGVGVSMNDPFENYRKSKGQAFVERMRARAEDRPP